MTSRGKQAAPTSPRPQHEASGAKKHMTNRATAKRNRPAYSMSKRDDKKRGTTRLARVGRRVDKSKKHTTPPSKEVRHMGPRHECLPFGGPHRHGIHYSTRTPRKAPDRAKTSQIKKISSSTKSPDISTIIDTRNGGGKKRGTEKIAREWGRRAK